MLVILDTFVDELQWQSTGGGSYFSDYPTVGMEVRQQHTHAWRGATGTHTVVVAFV